MRTTYHSSSIPPPTGWFLNSNKPPSSYWTTVVSPKTGKQYGLRIDDNCGELAVYGPTFSWPAIRAIIRKSQDGLDVTEVWRLQQNINDYYLTGKC